MSRLAITDGSDRLQDMSQLMRKSRRPPRVAKLVHQLQEFLDSDAFPSATWLTVPGMSVYVRKAMRCVDETKGMEKCLDIATVSVDEEWRKQGFFGNFMAQAEEVNPYPLMYGENATNPIVSAWHEKYGWQKAPDREYSYYKRKQ